MTYTFDQWQAREDQWQAAIRTVAESAHYVYRSFIHAGFPSDAAFDLTRMWVESIMLCDCATD